MKTKDLKILVDKSLQEIEKGLSDKRNDLEKTRLGLSTAKEKNLKKVKNLRHEIAQILTVINQKKLIEAEKNKK